METKNGSVDYEIPEDTIEESAGLAIAVRPPQPVAEAPKAPVTAAQAKIEAIAGLTMSAYANASLLKLSDEEVKGLQADFPDEAFLPGAAGKEHLIYIQHAWLRDRLNTVLGVGQWSIIPRNRWAEPFQTGQGKDGSRVYVEAMLMIRGCFVAESIGEMEYYPHNPIQNYGDAVEGATTAALRRCCKQLGVGLQAWRKEWCDGWWVRRRGGRDFSKPVNVGPTPRAKAPEAASVAPSVAAPQPKGTGHFDALKKELEKPEPTPEVSDLLRQLEGKVGKPFMGQLARYLRAVDDKHGNKWLLPTEDIDSLPADKLAILVKHWDEMSGKVDLWLVENPEPEEAQAPTPEAPEPWRQFPMPFGKHAGVPLEKLEKNYLYGLWANYAVQVEYKGKPRPDSKIDADQAFRDMLDAAGRHYQFSQPTTKK